MKKIIATVLFGFCLQSQAQELPAPSPTATVQQRVGLTDVTVVYSRPSAKGRTIFGELVPYGKMWRTGANANTTIEFSTDVKINGETLPAGKYSIFTIPSKDNWIIIFNSATDLSGTSGYSEEKDVARLKVPATEAPMTETFTINFDKLSSEGAELVMAWENSEVAVPFEVESRELALKNIEAAIASAEGDKVWQVYRNAANYYYNNKMEKEKALEYINKSLENKSDNWYSHWLKAEILADQGKYKDAVKAAEKALEIGKESAAASGTDFGYTSMIEGGIKDWKTIK